ncbi:uncharacterized transporter slc-17.2-like [Haliotis rufescens]|uniref:uncharacterized transporter slc-17.2-like n=1 Tax=Haliotis rufescens TaxID=6454 RepID=UPI00201F571D|nr:uncharacterized transporter slc-17.2-like [Haliotis rufescens]
METYNICLTCVGGLCVLWCGVWCITVSSTPSQHPRISREERTYILDSIGGSHKVSPTPWLLMMTSAATWACLIGHVCSEWATQTLRTHAPTFMNEVFNFNITENGLLSSIPYMSQTVSSLIAGQLADYLRSRKYLSTTATRRIFQSVGFIGTGASLVCTGYVDVDDRYVAVFLLACAMWFIGLGAAGFMVNVVDFAPRHSGVLFGVINSIMALVAGVGGPTVAGALTPNKTQEEWRNVFYVCGGFCVLGTVVFGTQARGELQPWAVDQVEVIVGESKDVPTVSSSALQLNSGRLEEKTTRISTHL